MVVRFWIIIVPLQCCHVQTDVGTWLDTENACRKDGLHPAVHIQGVEILKSQNVTSSWGGDRRLPYAFTEQGIAMLSSVLKSQTAVEVNIRIMRAFVSMRRFIATNAQLFQRLETIEYHQLEMKQHQEVADKRMTVFCL